jgi:RAB protein geranylgeranyltransferase component A
MTFIHILLQVARDKTEELSEVIARLRAYERGHYGLEEAVDEVNTVKKHLKIKDRQIEELTQEANSLQVNIMTFQCLNACLNFQLCFK